jgi:BASS family bile acid:Na+ symporter
MSLHALVEAATPAIVFFLMAAVGLDLAPADLRGLRHRTRLLVAGLLAPPLLLPPLALGLVALLRPPVEVEAGLLLVAISPIGGISTTYSYLANAAVALSVTLTALSCLLAPLTLPATAALVELATGRALGFEVPVGVLAIQVLGLLALPVGVGMAIRGARPARAARLRPAIQRLALVAVVLLVALVVTSEAEHLLATIGDLVPLSCLFIGASFAIGAAVGRAATADGGERFTLAAEFATRNLGVAVALAVTLLGRAEFALFAATYFLVELVILLAAIGIQGRRQRRTALSSRVPR